jgi:two-component system cell cycle sensor histidine kinase/response regulator CckA
MSEVDDLRRRVEALTLELADAKDAVRAVAEGQVDAVTREGGAGPVLLRDAQEALRRSEARYRRMVETISEGVWVLDAEGATTFVNARMAAMLGYAREEMLGRTALSFMDDESRALGEERLRRRERGLAETHEHRYRRKDGSALWTLVKTNPLLDGDGRYEGALGLLTDITERRRAEAVRGRLASIVESSDDAILTRDLDGTILTWNRAAERLFLYTAAEAVGRPISMLYAPELASGLSEARALVNLGAAVSGFEITALRKDGVRVEVAVKACVLQDAEGTVTGASVIARDLSERREAESALRRSEEQLRQAQKMEAIGSLAGGIAHDFNNLLSVILSYTRLAIDELAPGSLMREDLEQVEKASQRAAALTRQLLAFSRQQILEPQVVDINQRLLGLEKMLRRVLGEDVVLTLLTSPALGRVYADPGQIEQVLMNLTVNARDAMPGGGRLTIQTANVWLGADDARQHGLSPGPYVMLTVGDTGTGMDAATAARVFDPFFTTKEPGKGTGLGLSTVFGIVKQSGGHVWVASEPGVGTTFKVYLPQSDRPGEVTSLAPSPQGAPRGTETVLLVEDDELVRETIRVILGRQGYDVLVAHNGGDALLICEQHPAGIDLMLTDVVMPRLNGRQLAERLAATRPGLRVLYMSGYTEDIIVHHGVLDGDIAYLPKPITPEALARKVRAVLDAPP